MKRYEYQGVGDPATDFLLIHGPDGMVSHETVLNMLNGIEILKRPDLSLTAVYRLEHVNRFVVESGGTEVVRHDLIQAMVEAQGPLESEEATTDAGPEEGSA